MAERIHQPICPVNLTQGHFPDPHMKVFIHPDTGRECMFIYVGRDYGQTGFDLRDWYVLYSEDLVEWHSRKVLDRKDTYLADDSTECWACDVVQSPWDGKYYLYYSFGGNSIGVAVSDRPDGPFRDAHGMTPLVPPGMTPTNSYDPDVILPDTPDGHAWIVFGSDWTEHYWALRLEQSMTEVCPETARRVPVYPDAHTPQELRGPLRSDQAEVFHYGNTWYLHWAGRYATSQDCPGPYIFRGNIGADIPHYPDGRAFIDHGSFVQWHGQWFYAISEGTPHWWLRQSFLMYLHFCDDGTLMFDETIRRCGVGSYCAGWERIEAEWYMAKDDALDKVELHRDGQHAGFGVRCMDGQHALTFPHVYDLTDRTQVTFCVRAGASAAIGIWADDEMLAEVPLSASEDFRCVTVPIAPAQDEMSLTVRLQGEITLDWFCFG